MLKKSNKQQNLFIVGLGIAVIIAAVLIFTSQKNKLVGGSETLSTSEYKKLSDHLHMLVDTQDPGVALAYLTDLMAKDHKVDNTCHPLVHETGHFSYMKYHDFNKAMNYQDDICGSGYMHGVVEMYVGEAGDINTVKDTICPPDSGKCYHALGHGFMFATENDLPKSLATCETYADPNQRINCYDGTFMENFATLQKVHVSKYLDPSNSLFPCAEQKTEYKSSCYFYSPRYYLSLHKNDYQGALKKCLEAEKAYQSSCTVGVGSSMIKENILNPKEVENVCAEADTSQITSCIDGMVSYYTVHFNSVQKGNDLCKEMSEANQQYCYDSVKTRLKNEGIDPDATRDVMGTSTSQSSVDRYLFDF